MYYTRLTEIVRQYLENRFGIQSLELTTAETFTLLKKTGFREDELFLKLRTLLTGADLVKFAKYKPDASENELNYDHAWDFVSLTRLVEEPLQSNDVKSDNRGGGMRTFVFASPGFLYLLLIIPAMIAFYVLKQHKTSPALRVPGLAPFEKAGLPSDTG